MNGNINKTEAEAIVEMSQLCAGVVAHVDGPEGEALPIMPIVVKRKDAEIASLSQFLQKPLRVEELVEFSDLKSMLAFTKKYKTSRTAVFVNDGAILVVFDYHWPNEDEDTRPNSKMFKARFCFNFRPEINAWIKNAKRAYTQVDFAEFLEENEQWIENGADLVQLAKTLEAKRNVVFKSGVNLENGDARLVYEETTAAKAGGKGEVDVPTEFWLSLPFFQVSEKVTVRVKLRWRIQDQQLFFSWWLPMWDAYVERIKASMAASFAEELPDVPMYFARI